MMDVITGKTRPDEGRARFGHQLDLLTMSEPEIARAGIGRKFQKPTVFEYLTVAENLELALAGPRSFWQVLRARHDAGRPRPHGQRARHHRSWPIGARRSPARSATATSSGSRSACC